MGANAKLGDVIEILTKRGIAYAQYVQTDKTLGTLIRVLPGLFSTRPTELRQVVQQKARWFTFFPLNAAIQRGILANIGNYEIPQCDRAFPILRNGVIPQKASGKPPVWYLYDGIRQWRATTLPPDFNSLSFEEAINDTLLIERIEMNWEPAKDARSLSADAGAM